MIPASFDYHRAKSLEDAFAAGRSRSNSSRTSLRRFSRCTGAPRSRRFAELGRALKYRVTVCQDCSELVECAGAPVFPGNLLVVGYLHGCAVVGAPGCARHPALNVVDLILPRLLGGERISRDDAAALGLGGLLTESGSNHESRA